MTASSTGTGRRAYRRATAARQEIRPLTRRQAGLASEEGRLAVGDIPDFASGGVTIFLAEID
jgi:hypothetical protein